MGKRHRAIKISGMKVILLLMLSVLMTCGINIKAEATGTEQSATGEGGIYNVFPNSEIMKQASPVPAVIPGVNYDKSSLTITLNNAAVQGTLQFNSYQKQSDDEMVTAHYTVVLNGESTAYALKLMDAVEVTIKGSGTLKVQAPNRNTDYGAAITFNDTYKKVAPKLIIEGGTVIVDSTYHGFTLKEAGCIYIKRGATAVTFIGKTDNGVKYSVLPSKDDLEGNESVPNLFTDLVCKATDLSDENKIVYIAPNGADTSKTISSTSLLDSEKDKYYRLDFGGVTATWQSEGTVIETDVFYPGQTAEYKGATPTKAADAEYTYTFSGWSPTPGIISADTTYTATYTKEINKYTVTWKNYDGTTLETDSNVEYGSTVTYNGETPTRAADAEYTYTFAGWSPSVTNVTGDATYTATYTSTAIPKNDNSADSVTVKESVEINSEGLIAIDDSAGITQNVITESIAANSSAETKAAIANANKVEYKVVSAAASNESTGASDLLEAIGNKNYTFGEFFDLSLQVFADGINVGNVTDLTGKIKITLSIPEALRKEGRRFIIVRFHNGKTDMVGNGTGTTATIETDGFSTYAIAYYDEADTAVLLKGEAKGSNKIKLTWSKISGATGYTLYGAKCGSKYKEIKTFAASKTKYVAKKLKGGKIYKYYVVAKGVKDASGDNLKSLPVYVIAGDGGKKGNPTKVTAKSKVTVKVGKKANLKAKVVMPKAKTHIGKGYCNPIRYISSDESVASVTKNGKVKGVSAGSCTVYAVASNGMRKKVKVTVK